MFFASVAVKSKVRVKDENIVELKMGRLVYLPCTRSIELKLVFKFPITPNPLSLASIYGTLKKTPKCKLSKHLKQLIKHREPTTIDVVIYDAMFIVQSLPSDLPLHFGRAVLVMKNICNIQSSEVHFVCDSYVKSIKNVEQQARSAINGSYHIPGADQVLSKEFRYTLRSPKFKNALIRFLYGVMG